jgi:biopolymer transport protein ExbB
MVFLDLMRDGGPVMWLILLCSVIAVFIFLEKIFYLHRVQINVGDLVRGLINVLKRNSIVEAISLCDDTPGPAAHVLRASILAYEEGEEDLRQAIDDAALGEIPRLEARMKILATIGYITPLLGLLGTVLGMIDVFHTITELGAMVNANDLARGIGKALFTTAGGLCVAIPCFMAYNYLVSRIESITLDMEKASSEIIYFFKRNKVSALDKTSKEQASGSEVS